MTVKGSTMGIDLGPSPHRGRAGGRWMQHDRFFITNSAPRSSLGSFACARSPRRARSPTGPQPAACSSITPTRFRTARTPSKVVRHREEPWFYDQMLPKLAEFAVTFPSRIAQFDGAW